MRLKHILLSSIVLSLSFLRCFASGSSETLPIVDREGISYYQYKVKEGESLYGIAKQMGWDYDLLDSLNPGASDNIKKGFILIYPTGELSLNNDNTSQELSESAISFDKESGNISSKETKNSPVYSDEDSFSNPYEGVSQRNPLVNLDKNMLMEYTIQPGDTPDVVASNFDTTVRDIFFLNKGVSEAWFPEGLVINLLPGSKDLDHHYALVTTRLKIGERDYKIKAGDTLNSIAKENNLTVEEIKKENPYLDEFRKGKKIILPIIDIKTSHQDVVFTDPREKSREGRTEIFREVADYGKPSRNNENYCDIVVLTSASNNDLKRDRDFLRGFLLGVNETKTQGKKIGVQIIDISGEENINFNLKELKSNHPDIIVATFEKDLPLDLINFAEKNGCKLINVFDAKSESYLTNSQVVQILMPSAVMNEKIAENIFKRFRNREFVFLEESSNDSESFSSILKNKLKDYRISYKDLSSPGELSEIKTDNPYGIVIVSGASTSAQISSTLQAVESYKKDFPETNVSLIGRPTWIVHADKMATQLKTCDTYIPSRFFYDNEAADVIRFNENFNKVYNVSPAPSFPPYAAMGYDIARFFIASALNNNGDFNLPLHLPEGIEITFDFKRESAHSGLVNNSLYLMHYNNKGIEGIIF